MNSTILKKIEGVFRYTLLYRNSNHIAFLLINEFPKSGGTWLARIVSDYTKVTFPENVIPKDFPCIFHGHYLTAFSKIPIVVVWRDPRDIIVSWYHHCLIPNKYNNSDFYQKIIDSLRFTDVYDIQSNLSEFIKYSFEKPIYPKFSWNEFFDFWFYKKPENIYHTSYERLSYDITQEMHNILSFLQIASNPRDISIITEQHSFYNLTKRLPGDEKKTEFLRKGVVGDWKNYFDDKSKKVFNSYVGDRLTMLKDRLISI